MTNLQLNADLFLLAKEGCKILDHPVLSLKKHCINFFSAFIGFLVIMLDGVLFALNYYFVLIKKEERY